MLSRVIAKNVGDIFFETQCTNTVMKKRETKMFFCNNFYKTRAILMKFGT